MVPTTWENADASRAGSEGKHVAQQPSKHSSFSLSALKMTFKQRFSANEVSSLLFESESDTGKKEEDPDSEAASSDETAGFDPVSSRPPARSVLLTLLTNTAEHV